MGCEVSGPDTSPSFVGLREDKLAGKVVREVFRMSRSAGAQWELRCPLARTDQWVRRRSARQERTDLPDRSSGSFLNEHRQHLLRMKGSRPARVPF